MGHTKKERSGLYGSKSADSEGIQTVGKFTRERQINARKIMHLMSVLVRGGQCYGTKLFLPTDAED